MLRCMVSSLLRLGGLGDRTSSHDGIDGGLPSISCRRPRTGAAANLNAICLVVCMIISCSSTYSSTISRALSKCIQLPRITVSHRSQHLWHLCLAIALGGGPWTGWRR
ncbi:hypothetical protein KM472_gp025 [Cynomolgus macaque cytomegalovirus strain Ottawa]|uniref:Uncharacterized protein n=1 Tax=macacine betaherpesvirus 8 TaxID=2560567 RepID=G8H128_9BETA|nr:hypothetical protein KM472_gp025 [Cynomolgus macaque cytomegalovirus strain Ottawa]AEQ32102.1 hypothetical protein cy25 [Cynomolgus macaque cytomegalovirus strain Ottawa]